MFDIVGKRTWFFAISLVLILASAIALAVLGLKPGIDFSSGSIMTLSFEETVSPEKLLVTVTTWSGSEISSQGSSYPFSILKLSACAIVTGQPGYCLLAGSVMSTFLPQHSKVIVLSGLLYLTTPNPAARVESFFPV